MNIYKSQDQQRFTTPNAEVCPLATPRLGATQLSVIRQTMGPGHSNPMHSQTTEEVMVMLSGSVEVTVKEEQEQLHPGDILTVPAGVLHKLENKGEIEAVWLIISPAGMQFLGPDGQRISPEWAQ